MMKIILRHDSRDKVFHNRFGQVIDLPNEANFDTHHFDAIQPIGNVQCTCYTVCDIATDQTNKVFDIDDLWKRISSNQFGADPREVLGEAVKNGLLPKGKTTRLKNWKSYWRADVGIKDPFDNVRSTMHMAQSPIKAGTYWYREWLNADILPIGKTPMNGHAYAIEGWKQINGQPHLIIEAWVGRKLYMPREVFNEALKPYGMQTWVLSTAEIDERRVKTLTETIKDLMINLIIRLKESIKLEEAKLTPAPKPEPVGSLLLEWASAIKDFEGYFPPNPRYPRGSASYRNHNPGNIKGLDGKFLVFETYQGGWAYLLDYLTRSATGKHKAYPKKGETTILEFTMTYAPAADKNHPEKYCDYVCKRLGITRDTKIKTLI